MRGADVAQLIRGCSSPSFCCDEHELRNLKPLRWQEGELLCHCDKKKMLWYVKKGLADRVEGEENTIQLRFQHKTSDQVRNGAVCAFCSTCLVSSLVASVSSAWRVDAGQRRRLLLHKPLQSMRRLWGDWPLPALSDRPFLLPAELSDTPQVPSVTRHCPCLRCLPRGSPTPSPSPLPPLER